MITLPSETRAVGSCILVVDDDEGVRENLAELFGLVGYSVLTAANATEAMEAMRKNSVDLLLTDYRMPGPNGVELIESARRAKPGLRAILMTAVGGTFTEIESGRRFGIPIAACYRRIKELEGLGLAYCERAEPTRNGRGLLLYRSD